MVEQEEWVIPAPQKGRGVIDFPPFKTKRPKKCEICGYSNVINVHHITDLNEGGDHCEENTILLCPNHHAEVHRGLLKLEKQGKYCEAFYKLPEFSIFWMSIKDKETLTEEERDRFLDYHAKYGFDKDHAIAYFAGITRKSLSDFYS